MKKTAKKIFATAMAVGMVGSCAATSALASNVTSGDNYIANDYVKIITGYDEGDYDAFYMMTTGGNPENELDNGKVLLYNSIASTGYNDTRTTSRFYAEVDGEFCSLKKVTPVIDAENGSMVSHYSASDLDITRSLRFIPNKVNGREDTVEVKFTAKNNTTESHNIKARIMLDTMLGENDKAPFRVEGVGAVTTRTQLEGDEIPVSYQAFDKLSNPTVVSTGSFATGAGKPDIVQFNNWSASAGGIHNEGPADIIPECDASKDIDDSAVNAIWNEKALAPGESRDYVVYYGLGEVEVQNNSELVLGATRNESAFEINEDGTAYNPVKITGYLKNAGNVALNNVSMSIDLPQGVTLAEGEQSVQYANMASSEEQQNTWTLSAEPSDTERTVTVTVNAASDETGDIEPVVYTYTIPAIENAPTEPTEPTEPETAPTEPTEPETAPTEPTEPETTPTEPTEPETTPTEPTEPATTVTEPATIATQPTTQKATQTATVKATTVTTTTTTTTTTSTPVTTSTGKVATGDSTAVLVMLAGLLTASGVTVFTLRKKNSK